MLGRRSRGDSPQVSTGAGGFAAKADDLESLRSAVVDAASVGTGLWLSYLFVLFYFAVAAGAVTHRNLLLEEAVKLPFLNVELPLTAFFVLGPLVFIIVHGYVLLHFVMLAGKVGAFDAALSQQIADDNRRTRLRRQLPSNVFVQFLAGPREVRHGVVGFLLKAVAWISLVFGPIGLLVLFQLQFLPYHDPIVTWWHRIAVAIDLVLLWLLWPPILRGETRPLAWHDFGRGKLLLGFAASLLPLSLVFAIATFPGEWLNETLPSIAWVPTKWPVWPSAPAESGQAKQGDAVRAWSSMGWTPPHRLLVAGEPDRVRQRPGSVWSNVLVLPKLDLSDRPKLSFRGRHLEQAIFADAVIKKADFTGAELPGADLSSADLREAKFECDDENSEKKKCSNLQGALLILAQLQGSSLAGAQLQRARLLRAQLQGASLDLAQLQGALLGQAQLQGASLAAAQLQGATLDEAQLQGASLFGAQLQAASLLGAQLQGASLDLAQLQGAWLDRVQLQGASLDLAHFQGASLSNIFVWRSVPPASGFVEGALIRSPVTEARYLGEGCGSETCDWTRKYYETLKAEIDAVSPGPLREAALERIKPLGAEPFTVDEKVVERWQALAMASEATAESYPARLAETLFKIRCEEGTPYVIDGLLRQFEVRFKHGDPQTVAVAKAFQRDCPGARAVGRQ
jgi:uncharacterized protein YjbI with pentapeptide repeats